MVVLLPVFVLAEGAAVASRVAAAARLTGFPPAVPAALVRFTGVLLLIDDCECLLRSLPLGLGQRPLHFRSFY